MLVGNMPSSILIARVTALQRTGPSTPTLPTPDRKEIIRRREIKVSFSNPPVGNDLPPKLSAPVGHRGILAEVRAPYPLRPTRTNIATPRAEQNPVKPSEANQASSLSPAPSKPIPIAQERGTMTRGYLGGRPQPITELAWLSSFDFKPNRGGSSGRNSGQESGQASRMNSRSRPPSIAARSVSLAMSTHHANSDRKGSQEDDHRGSDPGPSLHDE